MTVLWGLQSCHPDGGELELPPELRKVPKRHQGKDSTPGSYLDYSDFCGPSLDNWIEPGAAGTAEEPRQALKVASTGINVEV